MTPFSISSSREKPDARSAAPRISATTSGSIRCRPDPPPPLSGIPLFSDASILALRNMSPGLDVDLSRGSDAGRNFPTWSGIGSGLRVRHLDQRLYPLEPGADALHHLVEGGTRLLRARLDPGQGRPDRLGLLQAGDRLL